MDGPFSLPEKRYLAMNRSFGAFVMMAASAFFRPVRVVDQEAVMAMDLCLMIE
jgi:hypothetical protein